MARPKDYATVWIESVEIRIALWELRQERKRAEGLRLFFQHEISEDRIDERKDELRRANPGIDREEW